MQPSPRPFSPPSTSRFSRTPLALAAGALALGAFAVGLPGRAARTDVAPAVPPSSSHAAHADCLWYSARNHGFYLVQRELVRPGAGAGTRDAWQAFLDAAGVPDCGMPSGGVEPVVRALAASADDADRFFLGGTR